MPNFRICQRPGCGRAFEPTRRWQIYCSKQCRTMAFYIKLGEKLKDEPRQDYATPLPDDHPAMIRNTTSLVTGEELEAIEKGQGLSAYDPNISLDPDEKGGGS